MCAARADVCAARLPTPRQVLRKVPCPLLCVNKLHGGLWAGPGMLEPGDGSIRRHASTAL